MFCPHCQSTDHRVVDTRSVGDGIRRRRECHYCGNRFTTYEQIAATLMVVKSDGRREQYDRQKLLNGIRIACAKRPIAMADVDRLVDRVEEQIMTSGRAEIHSFCHGVPGAQRSERGAARDRQTAYLGQRALTGSPRVGVLAATGWRV